MSLLRGVARMLTQREWEEGHFDKPRLHQLSALSGVDVTQETAMRMTTVYACVRLLSDSVAGLPLQTFSKLGSVRMRHDADPWIKTPNREYTRFRFWQEVMVSLLLDGNAFIRLDRSKGGKIISVWPYWAPAIKVERDEQGYLRYQDSERNFYTDYDLLHISGLTLPGQLRGLSPVGYYVAQNAIGLGIAAEDYAASLFAHGAMPGGWIKAPSVRTKEQADALKEQWKLAHQGNFHEPAILGGDAEWKSESFDAEATQLTRSRSFQVEEICRIYGVPPHMVASVERSTSWGTGIVEQGLQWVVYSLRPWLERIEQAIEPLLVRPSWVNKDAEIFARFNVEGLLRGDQKSRMEAYEVGIRTGLYTANQCLAWEDLPPYEDGDKHYAPLHHYAIEDGRPQKVSSSPAAGE